MTMFILNQGSVKIPRYRTIEPETVNDNCLCYQCYKYGPAFFLVKLGIMYIREVSNVSI